MGDMDGGLGGWKDICIYLCLKRGFNLFSSECQAFLIGLFFFFSFSVLAFEH